MDTIRIENVSNYFWLGRYGERVYTTVLEFFNTYDYIIEHEDAYKTYCEELDIPEIYGDNDTFVKKYLFDSEDVNSVISNLNRAYDNAIIFRNVIKSDSLAYIDMAMIDMKSASKSSAPIIGLQHVLDNIRAFWSCIDDKLETDEERDLIFLGRYYERLDLYLRRNYDFNDVYRAYRRLSHRIERCAVAYDAEQFVRLGFKILAKDTPNMDMVMMLESIFDTDRKLQAIEYAV